MSELVKKERASLAGLYPEKDMLAQSFLWHGVRTSVKEWIKDFHDQVRHRPSFLFILFGCSLISWPP
jgi:hypothetical protein